MFFENPRELFGGGGSWVRDLTETFHSELGLVKSRNTGFPVKKR